MGVFYLRYVAHVQETRKQHLEEAQNISTELLWKRFDGEVEAMKERSQRVADQGLIVYLNMNNQWLLRILNADPLDAESTALQDQIGFLMAVNASTIAEKLVDDQIIIKRDLLRMCNSWWAYRKLNKNPELAMGDESIAKIQMTLGVVPGGAIHSGSTSSATTMAVP